MLSRQRKMKKAGLLVRIFYPFVSIASHYAVSAHPPKMDLLLAAFVGWLMGQMSCSLTPCDPEPSIETTPYSVHQFPNPHTADALVGIADMEPDVFYIVYENLRDLYHRRISGHVLCRGS